MRRAWERLGERLDEIEAAPVVTAVALFLAAFIGALALGSDRALNLILAAAFVWLAWNWGLLHSRTDKALDVADLAVGKIEAVENHLTGLEPEGTGRHAHPPTADAPGRPVPTRRTR